MKLKKVFSSIVALIMCLPLIPSLKSAQTAYAEIMGSYISWQEAYYRALLNFQSTNTYKSKENYGIQCSKYDLYDIDQNGTPELIISEGEFHTAECIVYTFYNSQLIKLNTFNMTYGVLHVNPDNNYLHIVILHVYYAKNVYINDVNNYHGDPESWMNIIANKGDRCLGITGTDANGRNILTEGLYQWTLKEWKDNKDNSWYIDKAVWFMAKKMTKTQNYYDELPGKGLDSFYGLVNGRYRNSRTFGKKDLIVDTPKFNIPTTVTAKHKDSIKIHCIITEISPVNGLISFKWAHPLSEYDSITNINGDYITFSSDSMVFKDIEYVDTIASINFENQEIFDNKTINNIYKFAKPETVHEYQNYYLKVVTDNSDVIPLKYPTEIEFDDNNETEVQISFKGVVNATSKWSPRIHNGYYYLNQHEYFAYSEFYRLLIQIYLNFDLGFLLLF